MCLMTPQMKTWRKKKYYTSVKSIKRETDHPGVNAAHPTTGRAGSICPVTSSVSSCHGWTPQQLAPSRASKHSVSPVNSSAVPPPVYLVILHFPRKEIPQDSMKRAAGFPKHTRGRVCLFCCLFSLPSLVSDG